MCRQPTRVFQAVSQNFSLPFQREPILGIRAGARLTHSLLLAGVHALEFIKHPTGYQHYQRYAPPPSRHDEVSPLPSGGSRTDLNASFGSYGNSCRRLAQWSSIHSNSVPTFLQTSAPASSGQGSLCFVHTPEATCHAT